MNSKDERAVAALAVRERWKSVRHIALGGWICCGVWAICWAAVRITGSETGNWFTVATSITIMIVAGISPPVSSLLKWICRFKFYIQTHQNRMVQLEASIDASRETSGANPDGTHDHDRL